MAFKVGLKAYAPLFIVCSLMSYILVFDSGETYLASASQELLASFSEQTTKADSQQANSTTPVYVIWTRWRSGSSYFGGIMSHAIPGTFYGYEPLHAFGINILRDEGTKTKYALKFLYDIARCKHKLHPELFKYFVASKYYFEQNPAFKEICHDKHCRTLDNLERACERAPLRVFKVIRLSLFVGKYLLKSNENMKIIYLVRDPRPTLKSRGQFFWCLTADCHDPSIVCDILEQELANAIELKRMFPDRFFYVRYEDLASNPKEEFKDIWESLGQAYTPDVKNTVWHHSYNHPKSEVQKNRFGVIKDSRKIVFSWRYSLDYELMKKTQDKCKPLLKKLGYRIFNSEAEFDDSELSPLTSKSIPIFDESFNSENATSLSSLN